MKNNTKGPEFSQSVKKCGNGNVSGCVFRVPPWKDLHVQCGTTWCRIAQKERAKSWDQRVGRKPMQWSPIRRKKEEFISEALCTT